MLPVFSPAICRIQYKEVIDNYAVVSPNSTRRLNLVAGIGISSGAQRSGRKMPEKESRGRRLSTRLSGV